MNRKDGERLDLPLPEKKERHVVEFDACRVRKVGDAAHHSMFDTLGTQATIEDLDQLSHRSPFAPGSPVPEQTFGLAVRLVGDGFSHADVDDVTVTDDRGRPLGGGCKSSGGGKPGVLVSVSSKRPLPARSRLRVTILRAVK